jgi:hypothetical protein
MPLLIRSLITDSALEAGPIVHTIFVLWPVNCNFELLPYTFYLYPKNTGKLPVSVQRFKGSRFGVSEGYQEKSKPEPLNL